MSWTNDLRTPASLERFLVELQPIADLIPCGIVVHTGGTIVFANRLAANLCGLSGPEAMVGSSLAIYVPPDASGMEYHQTALWSQQEPALFRESKLLRADGDAIDVEVLGTTVLVEGESATLALLHDVTERKKMEEQLRTASKIEAIGLLAGGIAHDFNNILAAIQGYVSLIERTAGYGSSILQRCDGIRKAVTRASDLTQQLATFARGGEPVRRPVGIAELVREAASLALSGANVKCEFDIPADLAPVEGDPGQISQVFANLVLNAGQAMPEGGIVRIEGANVRTNGLASLGLMNPGPCVKISVHDDGIGIPAEQRPRLFEPYFTTKRQGHGLGLYTAYSIVKRHGGAITFETQPGAGTTFNVYLPAAVPSSGVDIRAESGAIPEGTGRILVMDDEPGIRETMKDLLDGLGYDTVTAADGEAAVRIFAEEKRSGRPFDLAILDLVVPGGRGGLWAISRMTHEDSQVKAVVSSGYSDDPVLENPFEYGFMAALRKPFSAHAIATVLTDLLGQAAATSVQGRE